MKNKLKYIRPITLAVIAVIIVSQLVWIHNMYQVYQEELNLSVYRSLEKAAYMEFAMRHNDAGGAIRYGFILSKGENEEENHIVKRKITGENGESFEVEIDTRDPNAMNKLFQYMLKDFNPLNINQLDSIFKGELEKSHSNIKSAYVDYIDMKNNRVLASNRPPESTTILAFQK